LSPEGTESSEGTSRDGETLFDVRPDCDINSSPEEVGVLEIHNVTHAHTDCDTSTAILLGIVCWSGDKKTYTQAIPRIGIKRTLVLTDMFKPQIRKKGRIANVKSLMTEIALYRNVRPMMTSTLMQVPSGLFLSQKKLIGWHWKRVTKKKTRPHSTVRPIAA